MIRATIAFLLVSVVLGGPAAAQLREPLKPLEFLAGSCWTGSFPGGGGADRHCFESVFDGQFVRDRHEVTGGKKPYAGETIYSWDAKGKKVVYTYWASDGAMSTGDMLPGAEGELVFSASHTPDGGELTIKSVWTRRGPDSYEAWAARKADGEWREMWRMTMRREPRKGKIQR